MGNVDEGADWARDERMDFSFEHRSGRNRPPNRVESNRSMPRKKNRIFYRGDRTEERVSPQKWKSFARRAGVLIFAFSFCLFFSGCPKKPPKRPTKVSIPTRPAPTPSLPESLRPKREASQRIVQAGKEYLDTGQTEKAVQTFQEAINVDPENGLAYFYLAFSLYQTKSYEDALGLLDRAGTLLAPFPEWEEEVTKLKRGIEEEKKSGGTKKSEEKGTYF